MAQKGRDQSPWTFKEAVLTRLWKSVWLVTCRWTPKCFNPWRLWVLRFFGASIHGAPFVYASSKIYAPFLLKLSDKTTLGPESIIYNLGPITLGERVTVSQNAYLCNGSHDLEDPGLPLLVGNMIVGDDVFIGARAFVLPGVSVGEGAVVGACAVVTKDVEPWTVVAGNPARVVKKRALRGTEDGGSGSRQSAVSSPQ